MKSVAQVKLEENIDAEVDNPDKAAYIIVYAAMALSGFIMGCPIGIFIGWLIWK